MKLNAFVACGLLLALVTTPGYAQTSASNPTSTNATTDMGRIVPGDVNGDGTVDVADVVAELRGITGIVSLSAEQRVVADLYPQPQVNDDYVDTPHRLVGNGKV